ncbi:hypothetical protein [Mesorhizobium sp. B1-1-8]|uniref:hypothetical protein n=1 Tax=Mesorhizobium sp. B1-1-8 TaxID=2589976 RepID=UPI001128F0A7|nr:hypothetical protein [Mesorhizobium sp. B1-1-8]UCI06240.1 hypothetical protein FJ974_20820 [Mesorhizobium sp. B1-1-8]
MTAILRNTLLAAVAVSALAGSAMAGQQTVKTECENKSGNTLWTARCCGVGSADCLGGSHDHNHDNGGRGQKR